MLDELGLRHVADAPVGGSGGIRGVSGGERRRCVMLSFDWALHACRKLQLARVDALRGVAGWESAFVICVSQLHHPPACAARSVTIGMELVTDPSILVLVGRFQQTLFALNCVLVSKGCSSLHQSGGAGNSSYGHPGGGCSAASASLPCPLPVFLWFTLPRTVCLLLPARRTSPPAG